MPAHADFLVELGTEELPPKALRSLELAFSHAVAEGIRAADLGGGAVRSYATPRRLAVLVPGVLQQQPVKAVEKRGPPLKVAFDADGKATRAAEAFAQRCGVAVETLQRLETADGAWLVHRGESAGQKAAELLPGIVAEALAALPVPKRMRWGSHETEFVRPAHWLVMLLGDEVVPARILGLEAGRHTRGHRFMSEGLIELADTAAYPQALVDRGRVLPDFLKRQARVHELVLEAGKALGGETVIEAALLEEVTALVEWPASVTGRFDAGYLELPDEVLFATLQGQQRCFAVRGRDGRLLPNFIAITNLESRDPRQVQLGNERVVKPRLADAAFFWEQDLRKPLAEREPELADVVFQRGLGSLRDKSMRTAALATKIAGMLGIDEAPVQRAARLAKTDLLTGMVKEFPELQGTMGYHYALHGGESEEVATAIDEHYRPRHSGEELATSDTGRCLAVAERLDTLAGIFALGKRPTGNKDPFALRRAALGLLRTLIEGELELPLSVLIEAAIAGQPVKPADAPGLAEELRDFLIDRLKAWYLDGQAPGVPSGDISVEMFEAVRLRRPASALDLHTRLLALRAFMGMPEASSLAIANKRIANILKDHSDGLPEASDPALLSETAEKALHDAVLELLPAHREDLAAGRYEELLRRLATLRGPVDHFFTEVMVMCEDARLRGNRLALLQELRQLFLDVADLSCLSVS